VLGKDGENGCMQDATVDAVDVRGQYKHGVRADEDGLVQSARDWRNG
jgi:hypothetical protein